MQILYQPIKCQCCPHIETSQLICTANQLTSFYMGETLALNRLISSASLLVAALTSFQQE